MCRKVLCLVGVSLLLAAGLASAQTFGQITGRVVDASGGVLPGASITVTNPQTGVAATEPANSAGVYVFPNLLPGTYNVRDVGGYATRDGRVVRWRTLFRADSLHRLTDDGLEAGVEQVGLPIRAQPVKAVRAKQGSPAD